jgi:hypothetical protein
MADEIATLGLEIDSKDIIKATKELDKLETQSEKTEKGVEGISKSFLTLAGAVGTLVAAGAALTKIVGVSREFEVLNASLITATGSAEKAELTFKDLQTQASQMPFALQEVVGSFIKLKNLGLDPSERSLKSYGNTAAAMGKSLDQLIEAVADAATGEFERLKEFGIKSKSQGDNVVFTFRGVETTVQKSAEAIEGYLRNLGENEFAGAMAERVDTLDGTIVNLEDNWSVLLDTIGKTTGIAEGTKSGLSALSQIIQDINTNLGGGTLGDELDLAKRKLAILNVEIDRGNVLLEKEAEELRTIISHMEERNRLIQGAKKLEEERAAASKVANAPQALDTGDFSPFAPIDEEKLQKSLDASQGLWQKALDDKQALRDAELDAAIQHNLNLQQADADRINATAALEKQVAANRLSATSSLFGGLAALAGTFGDKFFEQQKQLGIAQAVIDTYVGANKAFAQGGIAGFALGAGIIATGLARVRLIQATKPGSASIGGGGGGGSSLSGGSVETPGANPPQAAQQQAQIIILGDTSEEDASRLIDRLRTESEQSGNPILPEGGVDFQNIQRQ